MVSAIKIDGVLPLQARAQRPGSGSASRGSSASLDSEITRLSCRTSISESCSKGFYVRTYAMTSARNSAGGAHPQLSVPHAVGHFKFLPGQFVTFDDLKQGRRDAVLSAMYLLYDVSVQGRAATEGQGGNAAR